MDSDEATGEQLRFVSKVKRFYDERLSVPSPGMDGEDNLYEFRISEPVVPYESELTIPKKFEHVNLEQVARAGTGIEELVAVLPGALPHDTGQPWYHEPEWNDPGGGQSPHSG